MRILRSSIVVVLAAALGAAGQTGQTPRSRVYSHPSLPSDATLARLNLRLAWRGYVPVDGKRDGILRIDIIDRDLFALTRSGMVIRMDAETGDVRWRARVGKPYTVLPYLGANSRAVYVSANAQMYALDRES